MFKGISHGLFVANDAPQFLQTWCVLRLGEPEAKVSRVGVFLQQVLAKTAVLPFLVELGMMVEAELYGATDDFLGQDEAVGFGDDFAVDAARLVPRRGSVVLGGLRHGLNLVFIEPFPQFHVLADDVPRDEMVRVATFAKSGVVVGGDGVDHVLIHVVVFGQGHAALNDFFGVVALVGGIVFPQRGLPIAIEAAESFLSLLVIIGLICHSSTWNQVSSTKKWFTLIVSAEVLVAIQGTWNVFF